MKRIGIVLVIILSLSIILLLFLHQQIMLNISADTQKLITIAETLTLAMLLTLVFIRMRLVNRYIVQLAEISLEEGYGKSFRSTAKELSKKLVRLDIFLLLWICSRPPRESTKYNHKTHGLGGWISSCQFAAFELMFHFRRTTIPFLRSIAWGEYDWIQGNAIELLIRFAAEGIQTQRIVDEIRLKFPYIRKEAQLYAVQPLLRLFESNKLDSIFTELMDIEDFRDAYEELIGLKQGRSLLG